MSDARTIVQEPVATPATAPAKIAITSSRVIVESLDQQPSSRGIIVFTLRPTGFEPLKISVTEGRYLLAVENRTGLQEVNLQLHQENGQKRGEMRLRRGKSVWKNVVDLAAGRYVVTESSHPEWTGQIIVTN